MNMIQRLEDRRLMSAVMPVVHQVIGIGAGNTDTSVHLVKTGIEVTQNGGAMKLVPYTKGVSEIDITPITASESGGMHTVELYDDYGVYSGTVVIHGVNGAVNTITVFNNSVTTTVIGGYGASNTETCWATGNGKNIELDGGLHSSNKLTSTAGNTVEKGGGTSFNTMVGQNGNQTLIGGDWSTDDITFGAGGGYTTVYGGAHASNMYHYLWNGRTSTGVVFAGGYSSNIISTLNGGWPVGVSLVGTFKIVKA